MTRLVARMSTVVALCLAATGCDLVAKVSARKVMVATLLNTPEVRVTPEMIADQAGFDGGFGSGDGGFSFDAGFLADAGYTVPPQTIAFAFIGERVGESLDTAPTPVTGAAVTVEPAGSAGRPLNELGAGTYQVTSIENAALTYEGAATYDFKAVIGNEAFIGSVENVPPQERVPQFHPAKGFVEQPVGQAFSFTRPEPPGTQEKRNLAFVTVVPISKQGQGMPTYTNVPSDPLGYLKLAAGLDAEWRAASITVPGSAFPRANENYLVLLQSAKLGGTKGTNLFIGSAILAGTADVAIVKSR